MHTQARIHAHKYKGMQTETNEHAYKWIGTLCKHKGVHAQAYGTYMQAQSIYMHTSAQAHRGP